MKRLMLIAVLVTAYFMTGLFTPVFAQQRIPLVTDSVYFYNDSISTTITLGKNEFLGQVWLDADRSLSVWLQFYDTSKEQWAWVNDGGSKLVYTVADSELVWVIPLEPKMFFSNKTIRLLITNDPADTCPFLPR